MKSRSVILTVVLCLEFAFFAAAHGASPKIQPPALHDFQLVGDLTNDSASFTLTAMAKVENPRGDTLELLSGNIALTSFAQNPTMQLRENGDHVVVKFDKKGEFPIRVQFNAAVSQADGWSAVNFHLSPGVLQSVVLRGMPADSQFKFPNASRLERRGADFAGILPEDGNILLSWKNARRETEGKLFFSADMTEQINVSPGLMRQTALFHFKVMQGDLNHVSVRLHGNAEITRVQGDQVLSWKIEPVEHSGDHRLEIQLNQAQRDQFTVQIQAQEPLGAFPQTAEALRMSPDQATGFSGAVRVVNEGAVRLEVAASGGMSQISPEQFAENSAFRSGGNQRFAYHFAGSDYALRIQADQILPEISASELLAYRYSENELDIDDEIELDIRDAPLRELVLRVPRGFAVAHLTAPSLSDSDYSLTGSGDSTQSDLRLIFGQPLSGRQIIQLRLEQNQPLGGTNWNLPRIDIAKVSNVRGYGAVAADAGFRLTTEKSQGLTEIAPAFFPAKAPGIQTAFRITDANWSASAHIERVPQTIQADVLHLFSVGEGIAYGSSVMNFVISGAPVSSFRIELSNDCANVEFTGKELRGWQTNNGVYTVQLQTPISGPYTLLATYERPFKAAGDLVEFVGARPLDVQSEQGYTLVTSAYQFQVKPENVSSSLLALEPAEVPPEYRLFTDAPVLAAYRYGARPFDLDLRLSPLAQGDSLKQVVDRALLETHISKEGQAVTSIRYFIKNRAQPNFRLTVPPGQRLWSATVNGVESVPVSDGAASLIPLPQNADPNAVLELDLKMASSAVVPNFVSIEAPVAESPVMLAEWKLEPDTGRRLVFHEGSVAPEGGVTDVSGFAQLTRLLHGRSWAESAASPSSSITLFAPVQQAGNTMRVTVANEPLKMSPVKTMALLWPGLLALAVWVGGLAMENSALVFLCSVAGWTLLAWAALRYPNGAGYFLAIVAAFVVMRVIWPAGRRMKRWLRVPAPATAALIVVGSFYLTQASGFGREIEPASLPDSVSQNVHVDDQLVVGSAKIRWRCEKGQVIPLLSNNAVLTHIDYPAGAFELAANSTAGKLVARKSGAFDIVVKYQIGLTTNQGIIGFNLPIAGGLVHELELTVDGADVDVSSPQAVSIKSERLNSNTVAHVVLKSGAASIAWKPRSRDVAKEKAVFYAEISPLYIPSAGVIEGINAVAIRPAQGEVGELQLIVPRGAAITDVSGTGESKSAVSLWRFDPDTRQLRVTLNPPQSRPFNLVARSRNSAGPFPMDASIGVLTAQNSAGQIGLMGIATSSEVQLDAATAPGSSPINLEDFPGEVVTTLQPEFPGLTLRRAFRYTNSAATISLRASAVEPDIRAESEDTLSLGEDRTVLAENLSVDIRRAGIFNLSFAMPRGFDVESITGPALSQWTESKIGDDRIITLHLLAKTMGKQSFSINLAGAGVKTAHGWTTPQIVVREAAKEQGTLLVVPEQGMRLQPTVREGFTQLDPQNSGIRQKGVLAFRMLQTPSKLLLDVDQIDAWVQVNGWQHADINLAQVKVSANLQYQIENTGLKSLRLALPADAEGVRFEGEQVGDCVSTKGADFSQIWEIKLRRRVMGPFFLKASYNLPLTAQSNAMTLGGIRALDVNSQRGFLTLESDPRIEIISEAAPTALQPTEWQSIPRELQRDSPATAATLAYRVVDPDFQLHLKLQHHEAAKLLSARVNHIDLRSAISDDGVMLTQASLEIVPGNKRLLSLNLPEQGRFWFAFVNDNSVWPWREGTNVLIPLEQQSSADKPVTVEFFYSSQAGAASGRELNLDLAVPRFDLPLENITWRVSLGRKWRVQHSGGALQLVETDSETAVDPANTSTYLESEKVHRKERTSEAQQWLALGNDSLQNGDPQQARRAFQAAFGLSTDDAAFNEDARVQLHNIKLQQALIGLNERQSEVAGDAGALGDKLRVLRGRHEMNYTQQDAKDIIDVNNAEDNAAFMRLSEKLIQQQDAAVAPAAAIRANIPQQGQCLVFHRAVAVDAWADLKVGLQAVMEKQDSGGMRTVILASVVIFFGIIAAVSGGGKIQRKGVQ